MIKTKVRVSQGLELPPGLSVDDFRQSRIVDAHSYVASQIIAHLLGQVERAQVTTYLGKFQPEAFRREAIVNVSPEHAAALIGDLLQLTRR